MFRQRSPPAKLRHLLKCIALFQRKAACLCPAQCRHHGTAAQCFSDVAEQCADIGALAAGNRQFRGLLVFVPCFQHNGIYLYCPCRTFDHNAPSCQFVQTCSLHRNRGVHRRHLLDRSHKLREHCVQCLFCHVHFRIDSRAGAPDIFCVGFPAELYRSTIHFRLIGQNVTGTGCLSHQHRQHTGCHRIQRSGMSQPPHMQNATQLADDIKRCELRGFLHAENPLHCFLTHAFPHSSFTASSKMRRTSSAVPST